MKGQMQVRQSQELSQWGPSESRGGALWGVVKGAGVEAGEGAQKDSA